MIKQLTGISRRQVLGGAAALAASTGMPAFAQARTKATLAYGSTGYTWATTFLAEAVGTWEANGIDLSVVDFPTGRESMQAVIAGSAEYSTSTDTPFVFAALQGLKPIAFLNYSRYTHDMKVVVRKDGSVDPASPAALKGKRVATRVGTSGQYMLAKYLEMAKLTLKDVTVIDMSPNDMSVALIRGDIDAFAWTGQAAIVAEKQSQGKTMTMKQDGLEKLFQSHQLMLTSERVVKEKPELLTAAVKAIFAAEEYMEKNANWAEKIAPRVKAPAAEINEACSTFQFKTMFDDRFLDDLVAEAEWAIAAGISRKPAQDLRALFRGLIYEAPVKAYKSDRVTLSS